MIDKNPSVIGGIIDAIPSNAPLNTSPNADITGAVKLSAYARGINAAPSNAKIPNPINIGAAAADTVAPNADNPSPNALKPAPAILPSNPIPNIPGIAAIIATIPNAVGIKLSAPKRTLGLPIAFNPSANDFNPPEPCLFALNLISGLPILVIGPIVLGLTKFKSLSFAPPIALPIPPNILPIMPVFLFANAIKVRSPAIPVNIVGI